MEIDTLEVCHRYVTSMVNRFPKHRSHGRCYTWDWGREAHKHEELNTNDKIEGSNEFWVP